MRLLPFTLAALLCGCFDFETAFGRYCADTGRCAPGPMNDGGAGGGAQGGGSGGGAQGGGTGGGAQGGGTGGGAQGGGTGGGAQGGGTGGGAQGGGTGGGGSPDGGTCAGQLCLRSRTVITNLWKARIWGASPDSLWLVGGTYDTDRARVFRWLGSGWSEVAAPTTSALLAVAGSSDSDVVTVGRQGNVFQWDGGAWAVVGSSTAPAIRSLNGLTLAGPQRWAVGASGVVMNGTQPNWTQDSISTSAVTLNDVHASGTLAVAVGRDALATHTTLVMERTGSSWGSIPSVTSKDLKRVFLLNSQEGFAVGNDGFILHRTAAGWSQEFITGTWHLEALWARAADDVFAGGWGTTLLHRNGAAWSALDLDPLLSGVTIRDVLGFGTSELWLVAESSSDTVVLQLERR